MTPLTWWPGLQNDTQCDSGFRHNTRSFRKSLLWQKLHTDMFPFNRTFSHLWMIKALACLIDFTADLLLRWPKRASAVFWWVLWFKLFWQGGLCFAAWYFRLATTWSCVSILYCHATTCHTGWKTYTSPQYAWHLHSTYFVRDPWWRHVTHSCHVAFCVHVIRAGRAAS